MTHSNDIHALKVKMEAFRNSLTDDEKDILYRTDAAGYYDKATEALEEDMNSTEEEELEGLMFDGTITSPQSDRVMFGLGKSEMGLS